MPLAAILTDFRSDVAQCDSLIANAHRADANGVHLLPEMDRQQITVAAFLNFFIAWEKFLENCIYDLMLGQPTISGTQPAKRVSPLARSDAYEMVKGNGKYFDFANREFVRRMVRLYFDNGYPFEPHLSSAWTELQDIRTIRNSTAHIQTTTQVAFDGLVTRIFAAPRTGMTVYQLLTAIHPNNAAVTIFAHYRDTMLTTAQNIATG